MYRSSTPASSSRGGTYVKPAATQISRPQVREFSRTRRHWDLHPGIITGAGSPPLPWSEIEQQQQKRYIIFPECSVFFFSYLKLLYFMDQDHVGLYHVSTAARLMLHQGRQFISFYEKKKKKERNSNLVQKPTYLPAANVSQRYDTDIFSELLSSSSFRTAATTGRHMRWVSCSRKSPQKKKKKTVGKRFFFSSFGRI